METEKFLAVCLTGCFVAGVGSCTINESLNDYYVVQAIKNGADPLEAKCAIRAHTTPCTILTSKR